MATLVRIQLPLRYPTNVNMTHTNLVNLLFQIADDLHWHHLNTKVYPEHKALEFGYDAIISYKDKLAEQLIPFEGKLGSFKLAVPSNTKVLSLPDDIINAAAEIRKFAEEKKYPDMVNMSDEIRGVGAKLKYLLNLS